MPVSYPPPRHYLDEHERPWYAKPAFYIPIVALGVLLAGFAIYSFILLADLSSEAEVYDLNQLEQMESASVILDRNEKMFGQIYVENRETVPYEQLPHDPIQSVVAVESTKFYQHTCYAFFVIIRAAFKNATAGHLLQGTSTITQKTAR